MTEIESFAILSSFANLGSTKLRFLVQQFGSGVNALNATAQEIAKLPGFSKIAPQWNTWQSSPLWQKDLELVKAHNITLIPFTSSLFPKELHHIPDPPALLYLKGEIKKQDARSIAVIGTRNATIYGLEMAESISSNLAMNGFTIISGLARGIDTAAHRGALEKGRTIGVIGSGLANIYPAENKALAEKISQSGAIISEYAMTTPPDRHNFPRRNRLVSGLTLATLLIEAPIKSGAMITMECARSQGRKLFALPGRADVESFRGNHHLIRTRQAILIEKADDIITEFDSLFSGCKDFLAEAPQIPLDHEERSLLKQMPTTEISIDALSKHTSLPVQQVQRILMSLMLKKIIKEFPGKIYKITAAGNTIIRHN